jgi:hypothetical protein
MATMKRITQTTVARMKVGEQHFDQELMRFGARCRPRGVTYFVKARVAGKQKWFTIGRHGVLTATAAREKARKLLADLDERRYAKP